MWERAVTDLFFAFESESQLIECLPLSANIEKHRETRGDEAQTCEKWCLKNLILAQTYTVFFNTNEFTLVQAANCLLEGSFAHTE
jgi:hypothetical protein